MALITPVTDNAPVVPPCGGPLVLGKVQTPPPESLNVLCGALVQARLGLDHDPGFLVTLLRLGVGGLYEASAVAEVSAVAENGAAENGAEENGAAENGAAENTL